MADGAAGVVWAVRLDGDGPTGGFFRERPTGGVVSATGADFDLEEHSGD